MYIPLKDQAIVKKIVQEKKNAFIMDTEWEIGQVIKSGEELNVQAEKIYFKGGTKIPNEQDLYVISKANILTFIA